MSDTNKMPRALRFLAFALVAASLNPNLAGAQTALPSTPVSLGFDEAITHLREIADARFAPQGRELLYAISEPPGASEGFLDADLVRQTLYLTSTDGNPPRKIEAAHAALSIPRCDVWSPNGEGFLTVAANEGQFGFYYYDKRSERFHPISGRPRGPCAYWAGSSVVFAAVHESAPQNWSSSQVLSTLSRIWTRSWIGDGQITVSSSNPLFQSTAPLPGSLIVADPLSGEARSIAEGQFDSITPSPDGRYIAALRAADEMSFPLNARTGRRAELVVVSAEGTDLTVLSDFDVAFQGLAWSPDGRRLLFAGRRLRSESPIGLFTFQLGGSVREIALPSDRTVLNPDRGTQSRGALPIGWIGPHPVAILVSEIPRSSASIDVSASPTLEYGSSREFSYHLYAFDGSRGGRNLTDRFSASVRRFQATADGDALVVAHDALWRLSLNRAPQRLTSPEFSIRDFIPSRRAYDAAERLSYYQVGDRESVAVAASRNGEATRLVIDVRTGEVALSSPIDGDITSSSDMLLTARVRYNGWSSNLIVQDTIVANTNGAWVDHRLGPVQRFSYQFGGRSLSGWVVLPAAHRSGPLPAIVWAYGGRMFGDLPPQDAMGPTGGSPLIFSAQLLAAEGYAVVYPSLPLSSSDDRMSLLASAAVAAIDSLASSGIVDANRVGLMGHSFGGYSAAAIAARAPSRFQAAVVIDGIYDGVATWGQRALPALLSANDATFERETRQGVELGQLGMGTPFWSNVDQYTSNSPIFWVKEIEAPFLIMQGDLDVSMSSLSGAERFYAALRRERNPSVLVRYWGEGHTQDSRWAVRDQWHRITAWFDFYLKQNASGRVH